MRFVMPLPPNRANDRSHWRKVHREKTQYWMALDNIRVYGTSLRYPGRFEIPEPPATWGFGAPATATATLYVWAKMDEGNALNRLKWPEDWLVDRGFIVDDSPEHLHWTGIPEQVIDRKNPRVVLTLEAA